MRYPLNSDRLGGMEGWIKRMKTLETGRGKETISSISPSPNFHGERISYHPHCFMFYFRIWKIRGKWKFSMDEY